MQAAQHCLRMYQQGGPAIWHRQVQRFLSPTYAGSETDPPLQPCVVKLASGHHPLSEGMGALLPWLGRMLCIRMSERSVEGIHSRVTSTYKRARAAKIAYVSMELRFGSFLQEIASSPKASWLASFLDDLLLAFSSIRLCKTWQQRLAGLRRPWA